MFVRPNWLEMRALGAKDDIRQHSRLRRATADLIRIRLRLPKIEQVAAIEKPFNVHHCCQI